MSTAGRDAVGAVVLLVVTADQGLNHSVKRHSNPSHNRQPLMVDAADLPEALRVQLAALDQARARSDRAKRSARRGAWRSDVPTDDRAASA